jgi:hypothetical protein
MSNAVFCRGAGEIKKSLSRAAYDGSPFQHGA